MALVAEAPLCWPAAGLGSRCSMKILLALLACCGAPAVLAHDVPGLHPHGLWQAWSREAWLWLLWLLPGLLAFCGMARLWRQAGVGAGIGVGAAACFTTGWLALGLSLLSPLDALGEELFWAHMVQHEVVMLVAAPLLVLGRPLPALVWGLPAGWRAGAARLVRASGLQATAHALSQPMAAWWVHALTLWGWHAPALFLAALRQEWVHDLQHASFFIGALVFWQALFLGRRREQHAAAVLYLFTTLLHTSILGALLAFSSRVWYVDYAATAPAWGLDALQDQQLGGLIMWVPGGVVYTAAALALFVALLGDKRGTGLPRAAR